MERLCYFLLFYYLNQKFLIFLNRYAYAYTCRTFNGDIFENPEESCKVLWDLSPILANNDNLVYESISQAIAASSSLTFQV